MHGQLMGDAVCYQVHTLEQRWAGHERSQIARANECCRPEC